MRIGIDGLHLFGNYAGIAGSLAKLVEALRHTCPHDEIVLYVPSDFKGPPVANGDAGLSIRKTFFPGSWRTIRTLWRNFRLQSCTYKDQCDLLHGPTYALPGLMTKPAVVTIHDVIAFSHPLFCTPGSARVQKQIIPKSVSVARRIIVPSLASKEELLRNVKEASAERIDVIPWGVGEEFRPLSGIETMSEGARAAARAALNLPERYVLYVGNIEPKKNLPALIQAFFAAKMNKKFPHKLVIAGQKGWSMDNLERLIREHKAADYVYFTGYVPQRALPAMYSLADLFVMPSLVEGFGMPVLEAMACGCPVVISSDAALQEVCASAARTVPYDAQKPLQPLREAIEELLLNDAARAELITRGRQRASLFTWERTAKLTRESYQKALQ
ncbi:MAG TPA: glycosyltransferase family 1 protein [Planctomycetota bacterium]|nr:glycosyltransferase family 1 protein [Planctomycetota bacterium]